MTLHTSAQYRPAAPRSNPLQIRERHAQQLQSLGLESYADFLASWPYLARDNYPLTEYRMPHSGPVSEGPLRRRGWLRSLPIPRTVL